jgi:hypothetical protein
LFLVINLRRIEMPIIGFTRRLRTSMQAAGADAKPKTRQAWELLQLAARQLHMPVEYYLYRFYERDCTYRHMLQFLPIRAQRDIVLSALNDPSWKIILDNKWLFHLHFSALGVPVSNVLGFYTAAGGVTRTGAPLGSAHDLRNMLEELRPASLVIKPAGGLEGKGLLLIAELNIQPDGIWGRTVDGRRIGFGEIADHLSKDHGVRYSHHRQHEIYVNGYVLEERLQQHPFFSEINPHTTNTLRLVTFADQGKIEVDFAVARFGRKGNMADNWDAGGVSVHIDPATGVLGRGVLKPKYGGAWLDRHPDTQVRFEGRPVPMWSEVVDACRAAARVLPQVRSIGWDVIVTSAGPRIIEGNPDWNLAMVQVHSAGYLQPHIRQRLERYGLKLPEGQLPAPRVAEVLRDLGRTNTVRSLNLFSRRR